MLLTNNEITTADNIRLTLKISRLHNNRYNISKIAICIASKCCNIFSFPFIQSGYGSRRGSQMATYPIDEGYVPEYHTGRRYSTQDQVRI